MLVICLFNDEMVWFLNGLNSIVTLYFEISDGFYDGKHCGIVDNRVLYALHTYFTS